MVIVGFKLGSFIILLSAMLSVEPEKELVFRNTPLEQVCSTLEQHFSIEFSIKGKSLKNQRVTAHYTQASLETILEDLAFVLNFRYERKKDMIVIQQ
ncbi:MAG: DUF4974 domain-containing protein [Bacteroidota bacterium]